MPKSVLANRNKLVLSVLSLCLVSSGQMAAMQDYAELPNQPDTPELMLNKAAARWVCARDRSRKFKKVSRYCSKALGTGLTTVGVGFLWASGAAFYAADYEAKYGNKSGAFIARTYGLGCAAVGTVTTTAGVACCTCCSSRTNKNDTACVDAPYIKAVFRILTIKPNLDEAHLTPEALDLLRLAHQNPFHIE